MFNLQTALQKGADSLALAGAAELDRKPTAIARADAAIANLVTNQHKFSTDGSCHRCRSRASATCRACRPATRLQSARAARPPTLLLARFVEVTVTTQTLNTIFPASFLGGDQLRHLEGARGRWLHCCGVPVHADVHLQSVGRIRHLDLRCREFRVRTSATDQDAARARRREPVFSRQLRLARYPDFGNGGDGANALRDALAKVRPPTCFVQNGVSQRTGNIDNADKALNTRFDLWDGPFNKSSGNANYRPAENVRKGYKPKNTKSPNFCAMEATDPNTNKLGQRFGIPGRRRQARQRRMGLRIVLDHDLRHEFSQWLVQHVRQSAIALSGLSLRARRLI